MPGRFVVSPRWEKSSGSLESVESILLYPSTLHFGSRTSLSLILFCVPTPRLTCSISCTGARGDSISAAAIDPSASAIICPSISGTMFSAASSCCPASSWRPDCSCCLDFGKHILLFGLGGSGGPHSSARCTLIVSVVYLCTTILLPHDSQ